MASSSGDRRSAALNYETNISSSFSDTWIRRVKAVEADECGIAFDRPLALREEQLLRQKVAETHGLPPDIKAAYDTWVLGCAR